MVGIMVGIMVEVSALKGTAFGIEGYGLQAVRLCLKTGSALAAEETFPKPSPLD